MRIGIGYDVHKLGANRKLIIGGVELKYHLGLIAHSDGDVLVHSIMDALLGALKLGDIGKHFPDTDPRYQNISSLSLLAKVGSLVKESGYEIVNIDSIIVAESVKMAPYISLMEEEISQALGIAFSCISVKATTEEGLGFTGKNEGIAAKAVCLLKKRS